MDDAAEMVTIRTKHSLMTRWMHWVNFPLLMLMIISGIYIYWANPAYTSFIPRDYYSVIGIDYKLAYGMGLHFFFMWLFAINGIAYVLWLAMSGEWRDLVPERGSWREAWLVSLHDLGLRKTAPQQGKFNGAQRITYTLIILLGGFQLLTGVAIYKPVQAGWLTWLLGGYESARFLHFVATILFVLFFVLHVVQVARAGWNQFRAMITGYEVRK